MMMRKRTGDIDSDAVRWAVRTDRGLPASEEKELKDWLAMDSRHVGAFARAQAMLTPTSPGSEPALSAAGHSQKSAMRWGRRALILGAAAAASLFVVTPWLAKPADTYTTVLGEVRSVPLEDGSLVTLNTGSRVEVALKQDSRHLKLLEGETFFEVAPDSSRPFIVEAGDVRVRAVGTAFVVRRLEQGGVEVVVHEGKVEMTGAGEAALPLHANMKVMVDPRRHVAITDVDGDELGRGLAWRDGKIAFTGETLAQAATEFNRYNTVKLEVPDASVARMTIAGWFSTRDPEAFARVVAQGFGLRVNVAANRVEIAPLP